MIPRIKLNLYFVGNLEGLGVEALTTMLGWQLNKDKESLKHDKQQQEHEKQQLIKQSKMRKHIEKFIKPN